MEQIKYEKLFATPFMRFRLVDHVVLDAALLLEAERMRAKDDGVSKSNRGGWHSKGNLFDSDNPAIASVREAAKDAVLAVTRKVSSKADPETLDMKLFSWMNANPTGGYNAPHTHPGAHWSGVYYVSQPETEGKSSGKIEFLDPRCDLSHWRLLDAPTFRSKRAIRPEAGDLIVFPTYLLHWVHPNESDKERVTIAFNATFKRAKK
ncbi:MAG: TIGR02466 family protein [Shimia sp.]|uniref:TIGR02466 family protein n=1 Tax=Shimia sp. TaxID=1954381 RepID=UPI004058D1DD